MRKAARIDDNQRDIVRALRSIPGVSVCSLAALGGGVPDLLVGFRGLNFTMEIKDGRKPPCERRLTDAEKSFSLKWTGQYAIVKNIDEALKVIGVAR